METITVKLDAVLKETAIVSVLKAYAKYLCIQNCHPEEIVERVNKIASYALDRGDISQNTLVVIQKCVEQCSFNKEEKLEAKFIEKAITCVAGDIIDSMGVNGVEDFALIKKVIDAKAAYKAVLAEVAEVYAEPIKNHAKLFYSNTRSLYDEAFGKFFE